MCVCVCVCVCACVCNEDIMMLILLGSTRSEFRQGMIARRKARRKNQPRLHVSAPPEDLEISIRPSEQRRPLNQARNGSFCYYSYNLIM